MSVLFQNNHFIYVSHQEYLNKLYKNINKSVTYVVNGLIFQINTRSSLNVQNTKSRKRKRSGNSNINGSTNEKSVKLWYDDFLKHVQFDNKLNEYDDKNDPLKFIKDFQKESPNISNRKGGNTLDQCLVVTSMNMNISFHQIVHSIIMIFEISQHLWILRKSSILL